MDGQENHIWRRWPLSWRRTRKMRRFDPDELLRQTFTELAEIVAGRLQSLFGKDVRSMPDRAHSLEDWGLLAVAICRLADMIEDRHARRGGGRAA